MFINNAWYIAALVDEVENGKIVARTILDQRIAVYKTASGKYTVLRDACAHRQAPLSLGKISGETIVCGYHGAAYGVDGACVHIPGQSAVPAKACVKSFPVYVHKGFIWVWLGNPEAAADKSTIPPSLELLSKPGMTFRNGLLESVHANYRLLNDNLFDITHAEYVHPETFGGEEVRFYRNAKPGSEPIDRRLTYEIKENSIHFRTHANSLGDEGAPLWRSMMAQARGVESWNEPLDFTMAVNWYAPCYTTFHFYLKPAGQPDAQPVELHDFHAAIPSTDKTTHYFYQVGLNYGNEETMAEFAGVVKSIFMQDVRVLEWQQTELGDKDFLDVPHISFSGDRMQLEGRKILERLAAADKA